MMPRPRARPTKPSVNIYRDEAAARQFTAQQDQVVVDTLDVAVILVGRALGEGLRVWVAWWRLAVEERELFEQHVLNARASAIFFELPNGCSECAPIDLVILRRLLLALLAGALL